jgi:hypothetical protein
VQLTNAIQPPDEPCTETVLSQEFVDPPPRFIEPQNQFRLIPELREAAKTKNPYKILARSAVAFYRAQHQTAGATPQEHVALGNTLADLAVTGRLAYSHLQHPPLNEVSLRETTRARLASFVQATPTEVVNALSPALDRAYAVAWALRGPVAQRAAARAPLGWIAVSGEDDMPHRPTNVPAPPFEQYEIPITVRGVTMRTRFFIASPSEGPPPTGTPHSLRELPPDPQPHIPDGQRVLLFIHGHSSSAEEALTIIPHIHTAGLTHGTKYSIISLDLPNNGYSESFPHTWVAPSSATTFPGGIFDHGPVRTPVIDFIEDFIVAFVDALDLITPTKDRFAGVFGGSLGGNMGLRLGRRNLAR